MTAPAPPQHDDPMVPRGGWSPPGSTSSQPAPPTTARPAPTVWPTLPGSPWPLAGLVVVAGLLFDQAVRVGAGLGAAAWAGATVAVVACAIAQHRPAPRVLPAPALTALAGAFGFAASLGFRASAWLVPLDLLAVLVLCAAAIVAAAGEDLWSLPGDRALRWFVHGLESSLVAPLRTLRLGRRVVPLGRGSVRAASALRGLAVAAPILLVIGALLVSADAFLASFLRIDVDPGPVVGHLVLVAVGAVVAVTCALPAGAPETATAPSPSPSPSPFGGTGRRRLGTVEASVVLGGLATLFAVFVAAAVGAAFAGDAYVRRQTGLSYAEYARRGFFQLLAVAAITVVVLAVVRARTTPTRLLRALGLTVVTLIVAVVVVALRRLALYEAAYGATMLRLYSTWFAWWLGAAFVVIGCTWAGVGARVRWAGRAAALLAFGWLAVVNLANPEAVVVERNLARAQRSGAVDTEYLRRLGPDATPALVAALERQPSDDLAQLVAERCPVPADASPRPWLGWSWSHWQAEVALARVCPSPR